MADATLNFYSWVRRGLAAGLTAEGAKLAVPVNAAAKENLSGTANVDLSLVGPADIAALDPRCILKKRPDANVLDAEFEPYAMVEFDQADLPWRYTPKPVVHLTDEDAGTLKTWIALIVLEETEGTITEATDGKLATVTANKKLLPELSRLSFWAHTQVAGKDELTDGLMASSPQKLVSRLICARQLEVNKTYNAFLVPTFKGGVSAGKGETPGSDANDDAWDNGVDENITLPVYYSWSFKTGNVGSFRELALRLHPGVLPGTIGWRAIDVSAPGLVPVPAATDPQTKTPVPMQVEGALQAPSAKERAGIPAPDEAWVTALKTFVETQELSVGTPAVKRKVVAPPLYGRWHANKDQIPDSGWFRTLNVDPTLRVGAALGTAVVQKEQEPLMASAWRQAGELPTINRALKILQLACEAYAQAFARHFKALSDQAFVQRVRTLHGKVPLTATQSLAAVVEESCLNVGVLTGAWRRQARWRGKLGRLGSTLEPKKAIDWVNSGNWLGFQTDTFTGFNTFDAIMQEVMVGKTDAARAQVYQEKGPDWCEFWGLACIWVGRSLLKTKQGHYWWLIVRLLRLGCMLLHIAGVPGWTGYEPWPPIPEVTADPLPDPKPLFPLPQDPTVPTPQTYLHPRRTLPWQFWRKVRLDGKVVESVSVDPIMKAPAFPQPMYEPLRDISKDWILPGVSDFGANTVAIALTNQKFIEAYMVGLNHEMARELVWRDYPTDRRGSCFRQFWDTRGRIPSSTVTNTLDISAIHEWATSGLLGKHRPAGSGSAENQVVLMVRGDLIVRYPNVVVYARKKPEATAPFLYSLFQGLLPPDIGFYGFDMPAGLAALPDWEFVIQERPGELRFAKPTNLTSDLPLELVPTSGDFEYLYSTDGSGQSFATNTIRRPTRIVIDGSDLVTSA